MKNLVSPAWIRIGVALVILALTACGGGGGGGGGGTSSPPNCGTIIDIAPDSTTNGSLTPGDCTIEALFPGSADQSLVDLYRVTLPKPGTFTIRMVSTAVDSYLALFSFQQQNLLAEDDDGGGNLNAQISLSVEAGAYLVLANTATITASIGAYTLTSSFDPDVWTSTSTNGAPDARRLHSAVWTGSEMIVWGGDNGNAIAKNTGGRFNPTTNTWMPITTVGAPSARFNHTAVWTGTEMVVWGGFSCNACANSELGDGARYNPTNDVWTQTSIASAPSARGNHTAVWTGSKMIVWGGEDDAALIGTGGSYDPLIDSWVVTSPVGAPPPTRCHAAVWTGTEMIIFGGQTNRSLACGISTSGNGARYNPTADSWTATVAAPVSSTLSNAVAVWSGSQMITWFDDRGARYNPGSDSWNGVSTSSAPSSRRRHSLVWTGSTMIVWGGDFAGVLNTGGIYDPSVDSTP